MDFIHGLPATTPIESKIVEVLRDDINLRIHVLVDKKVVKTYDMRADDNAHFFAKRYSNYLCSQPGYKGTYYNI